MKAVACVLLILHFYQPLFSQSFDSTLQKQVSTDTVLFANKEFSKKNISAKKFILPGALFGSGLVISQTGFHKKIDYSIAENFSNTHKTKVDNYLQYTPAITTLALDLAGVKSEHNIKEKLVLYAFTTAITTTLTQTLKHTMCVMRPDSSARNSFPSGHTATAFAAAQFLHNEYGGQSIWYSVAGYTVAGATGFLRIHNNRHWLSDVVAGAGIGIASTQLAYLAYPLLKKMIFKKKNYSFMPLPYYNGYDAGLKIVVINNSY